MMQEIPNNVRIPSATEWHLPLQLHGEPLPYRSRVPSVGKCADTRRVTFGSPSVGSLRCTGRTAWLERRRKQAGHTLLDDVFPIFMALVELFGEAFFNFCYQFIGAEAFETKRQQSSQEVGVF